MAAIVHQPRARPRLGRRLPERRVWLDPDLHTGQAPAGWIQARSAAEAIQLLEEFTVDELSVTAGPDAGVVIDWLIEEVSADRDPWPAKRLVFHGAQAEAAIEQFADTIRSTDALRRTRGRRETG